MSTPSKTKRWALAHRTDPNINLEGDKPTFKLETVDLPELKDGDILVKTLYLSNDPAQSTWISSRIDEKRLYTTPVKEGDTMRASAIAKVVESKADKINKGDLIQATVGWTEYCVLPGKEAKPIKDTGDIAVTHYLGALGLTGLTAYYGLIELSEAKQGETVVVSGAAGAVGSMVVQLAKKLKDCGKVIGLAGTDEKCRWVEELGADICINYKNDDWRDQLEKATDSKADIYFDNVGGEQLDFMLTQMNKNGRIAACGAISDYQRDIEGMKNWFQVVSQRLSIKGFIVLDWLSNPDSKKAIEEMTEAVKSGKLKLDDKHETVVNTKFEDVPKTYMKLFDGGNQGKLISKLE